MRRARVLVIPLLLAWTAALFVPTTAHADSSAPAQCTTNMNNHFGIAAPWDGACWAAAFDNVTQSAGDSVATMVTRWVMSGAVETTDLLLNEFGSGTSTRPAFDTPWFQKVYYGSTPHAGTTLAGQPGALAIAELIAVPLLVLTIIAGVVRGEIGGTLKTVLVRLPLVIILCFTFIALLERVFDVIDVLSTWVIGGTVADFQSWTNRFDPNNVGADFAIVVVCIVIVITTLIAYIELFVRSAMIYLVVAFVPIIAVATLWQGSRSALKKTAEFLAVMTCSKLVMAFAFMVGAGALTAGDAQSFAPLLVGAVIFGVIAFSPFALFTLIPIVEAAVVGGVAGLGAQAGTKVLSRGLDHGGSAAGKAPQAAKSVGHTPTQARALLDAGARRMKPIGDGLRGIGGALVIAGRGGSTTPSSGSGTGGSPGSTPPSPPALPAPPGESR